VAGLDAGADDYLVKPLALEERGGTTLAPGDRGHWAAGDDAGRADLGRSARARALRYDWPRIAWSLLQVYDGRGASRMTLAVGPQVQDATEISD
jgi:hypothetical protein